MKAPTADVTALSSATLLNSLEGVCYLVGFNGSIKAIGATNWNAAADLSGAKHLHAHALIGANVFDYVSGEEVLESYQRQFFDLQTGRRNNTSFGYRCDAPHIRREMRMCLSCVHEKGRPAAVLCQSIVLTETLRPPMNIFDAAFMRRIYEEGRNLPFITMCSYCHKIKLRGTSETWQTAEQYYQAGGSEQVRISHGMCLDCYHAVQAARKNPAMAAYDDT